MNYTINRLITGATFDAVDARTRTALAANGFGVLTEIDVAGTRHAQNCIQGLTKR